jgi:serine/threonine-protein kinase
MPGQGDTLAHYVLGRRIGQGASASVHLAQDQRDGGWVALKTLHTGAGMARDEYEELRQRFLQEAQIAQRLKHLDIVSVLGAGDSAGSLWLAMEIAPGCGLDRYLTPQRLLPPALVVSLGERIAGALAHAHAQGVVHRDIKPSNVIADVVSGSLKLTDFGTAHVLEGGRTRTGVMLGTPAYMAPEQLAGAGGDARADLYSLGVMLFEMLTARRPHEATSMGEFLRQVATQPAPPLHQNMPGAPPALAAALATLLSVDAAHRPASADQVAESLGRVRVHMQGPVWPPTGPESGSGEPS